MTADGFLNRGRDLVVNLVCIDVDILHANVHNDVEARELDLRVQGFPTVQHCEHELWHGDARRRHFSLPHVPVQGSAGLLWADRVSVCVPNRLKASFDRIGIADSIKSPPLLRSQPLEQTFAISPSEFF